MTQQTGWPGRIASYASVGTQLLIAVLLVALEAVITRVPRRSVSQETRIMKAVLLCRMLALIGNIVASRADHLSVFQRRVKFFTNILRADGNVGRMPAR